MMRYVRWLIIALSAAFLLATVPAQRAAAGDQGFGYPSVAAALEDLQGRSDVHVSTQGGWTIVSDRVAGALWSFTPPDHPAHPAAVKRTIVKRDGTIFIHMTALCEAEKAACDKLIAEFQDLNDKARQSMQGQ